MFLAPHVICIQYQLTPLANIYEHNRFCEVFVRCTYRGGVGGIVLEQHLGLLEEAFSRLHHIVSQQLCCDVLAYNIKPKSKS